MDTISNFESNFNECLPNGYFSKTWQHTALKESQLDINAWLNSSFPVLCQLLDKVAPSFADQSGHVTDSTESDKAIATLTELFVPNKCIPVFSKCEKFQDSDVSESDHCATEYDCNAGNQANVYSNEYRSDRKHEQIKAGELEIEIEEYLPDFCTTEYHRHRKVSPNLLQVCCGEKTNIYHRIDNRIREMDMVVKNPDTNICCDAMESSLELELPGPYSLSTSVKTVTFGSNRYGMDVLGLFLVLIDTIYAANCISYVKHEGNVVPFEFKQGMVKVVALIRSSFPDVFNDLQKLIMYSTVTSILKKIPFKWNRCLVHVLEDLLVHPLNHIKEDAIEFKLLKVVVQKRAKTLFKMFSYDKQSHIFNSVNHSKIFNTNFSTVHIEEIGAFLKTSAKNCQDGHRIKNIRYKVKDQLFQSCLKDMFLSYC